tara:strand:+ start:900 stop:1127 length:228 start_codon:yes stop_codon:yes gene_type:complete
MNNDEDTLELYQLIISNDEVEFEADNSITNYLLKRSAEYANKLGRMRFRIKNMVYHVDAMSGDHVFIFSCERDWR